MITPKKTQYFISLGRELTKFILVFLFQESMYLFLYYLFNEDLL